MKKKFYFENEDAETAHSEEYFREIMKEEGLNELKVLEAIPVPHSKSDFVYCMEADTCYEKSDCGKQCESYKPDNGKNGKCEFRGQYCDFGEEVVFNKKIKSFKGKAIYNPSGKAGEYSYWACNFYKGCSNGCTYCYLKKGVLAQAMGGDKPELKSCFKNEENALEIFKKEILQNKEDLQKHGLFFTFTSDPFLKETIDLTHDAIGICQFNEIPVKVLTKTTWWVEDLLLDEDTYKDNRKDLIAYGFTLTGHDELEPNASTNLQRIQAMKELHNAGFKIFASIEPIVDFVSAKNMIGSTLEFCDLYKIGLMSGKKYDVVEAQSFVEWLNDLSKQPKIYLKETLQELTHYTNEELDFNFVNRDYNMFTGV